MEEHGKKERKNKAIRRNFANFMRKRISLDKDFLKMIDCEISEVSKLDATGFL